MNQKIILFCLLIIGFSSVAFCTTYNEYYFQRILPGNYINQKVGEKHDYITANSIYGDTHEIATCTGPNENDLPDNLSVDTYPDTTNGPGSVVYIRGYIVSAPPEGNDKIAASIYTDRSENEALGIQEDVFYNTWRYQIDDYADVPQSTQIGTLLVLDNWTNDGWSNGYLFAEEIWYNKNIPADIDVFEVVTSGKAELDPGVYCIETEVELEFVQTPLEITVYEANGDNYGTQIAYVNIFDCFDDNGDIDNQRQRVYFLQETAGKIYIKVNSTETAFQGEYKIRALKTRPVILVHGINASPKSSSDPATTFEHIRDCLGYFKEVAPCICYDFPWWSKDPDASGFEKYVGINSGVSDSLYEFVYEKYDLHSDYKANIILHSMGGFIVRYQLDYQNFADMINQVLFINSPQYGSDLANFLVARPEAVGIFNLSLSMDTSEQNYIHLSRGSDTIWKMHNEKDINIPASRIAFTVGTSRGPYKFLEAMFLYDYTIGRLATLPRAQAAMRTLLKDRYLIGLKRSDGIVPVTSQNLLNFVPDIPKANYYFIEKHHTEAQKLSLNKMNDCKELYNLIKSRMNAQ